VVSFKSPPLYPRGKNPSIHWIGGWVGHTMGVDAVAKRKNFFSAPVGNGTTEVQPLD